MPDAIEQLRHATERDLAEAIGKLGPAHRRRIMDAIVVYGSARAIPASVWESIRRDVDRESAAILLLLLAGVYGAQYRATAKTVGVTAEIDTDALKRQAAPSAARLGRQVADDYVNSTRRRLETRIDDKAEAINAMAPKEAISVVQREVEAAVGAEPAKAAVVDNTTRGVNAATDSAAQDIGRQTNTRVVIVWVAEKDGKTCYICRAMDGKTSDSWDAVLDANLVPSEVRGYIENGGGAHPHCRCRRKYVLLTWSDN